MFAITWCQVVCGAMWMTHIVQEKSKGKRYPKRILLVFESLVSFVRETQLNSAWIWLFNVPFGYWKYSRMVANNSTPFVCSTSYWVFSTCNIYKVLINKRSALSWSLIFQSSIFSLCFYKHCISILLWIIFSVYFLYTSPWFYNLSFPLLSFPFFLPF